MKRNEDNLLICIESIGRLTENGTTKFRLGNNQIINILGTKGIKAIQAKSFLAETNLGLKQKLDNFIRKPILVLEDNVIYRNSDGSIDLKFRNYNYQANKSSSQVDDLEKIKNTKMAIEEEFTWKEMNKTLDSRCDQLIMVMSNDQAVEVQKGKMIPNTQMIQQKESQKLV